MSLILYWNLHVFFNWARNSILLSNVVLLLYPPVFAWWYPYSTFYKNRPRTEELTLLSSLRRMSFKTLFVRGLAISPILYRLYKKLQVNLKWNRKVFYTFLIFRLETWWVVSPLTKYDVMSKAKWLFAHFT